MLPPGEESDDELLAHFLETAIGRYEVLGEQYRHGTASRVLELRSSTGERWIVKRLAHRRHWDRELEAYRLWTPFLGDRAPRLHACHERLRVLVLGHLAGRRGGQQPDDHAKAGDVLRRLHDSQVQAEPWARVVAGIEHQLASQLRQAADGLILPEEVEFVYSRLHRLARLHTPVVVTHGDYGPHNWVVDDLGLLRVIDFAGSRLHSPAYDFAWLSFHHWWGRPELQRAFFAGYGRAPSEEEQQVLESLLPINALRSIARSRRLDRPRREARARQRLSVLMAGTHPG